MMRYIDFHTHRVPDAQNVVAVVDGRDTWGIHPWKSLPAPIPGGAGERVPFPFGMGSEPAARILAIGECGLDALRGPSMDIQEQVFRQQIALGEEMGRPLVVHCVKAIDRLLQLRRELRPAMPWMIHGFRGKPRQLQSLLDAGLYVGFGFFHNDESLLLCPLERMMTETDDSPLPIEELYENVAAKRGIDVAELCSAMAENYRSFFQKEPLTA